MAKPINCRLKTYRRESIHDGMRLDDIIAIANENTTAKIEISYGGGEYEDDYYQPVVELVLEEEETDEQMTTRLDEEAKLAAYLKDQKKKDKAKRVERDRVEYERLKKRFEKG